jgi:glutamate formiminotransferase/formiminotetrahydrofolate cyclodeaminase
MVGWMTYGKRKFEDRDEAMRKLIPPLNQAMSDLIPMIDADTNAFNDYMAAAALPADTPEHTAVRRVSMQDGLRKAVEVPLRTMRIADDCWDAMLGMAEHGNPASRSDLEVGARALEAGIWGAYRNVVINLPQLEDEAFRAAKLAEAEALAARAKEQSAAVLAKLARKAP